MTELLEVDTEPKLDAQTPAPPSEPTKWMPLSDEQRNAAPEAIQKLLADKKWSSFDEVADGYTKLEKVLGRGDHIFKPSDPNDTEGWNKYWQKITGVSGVDDYEFEADEAVPFDDGLLTRFKDFANKQHYTKEQAAGAVQFQRDIIKEVMAAEAEAKEEARKALLQKAGSEPAYKEMLIESRRIADELGIYQTLERKGLASDLEIIGMLQDIKDRTTEGVIPKGDPPVETKDPKVELEEIMKSEAFKGKFHPQHKEVMRRYMALNMLIANTGHAPKRPQGG